MIFLLSFLLPTLPLCLLRGYPFSGLDPNISKTLRVKGRQKLLERMIESIGLVMSDLAGIDSSIFPPRRFLVVDSY